MRCIDLGIKLNIMEQKNEMITKKYEDIREELRRLKRSLNYHQEKNKNFSNNRNKKRCEVCFEKSLDLHQHICLDQPEVICEYCSTSFKSTLDLGFHLIDVQHPETQLYKCDECTMGYSAALLLKFHQSSQRTHTRMTPNASFECYLCRMDFWKQSEVKFHLKLHVAARDKKCDICNEPLTSNELTSHLCGTETSIKCEYCSRLFNVTSKLLQHLGSEHDDKIFYRCRRCNRYFDMEHLRDLHEKQHKELDRPFACDKCQKGFSSKVQLRAHQICHSDESMKPSFDLAHKSKPKKLIQFYSICIYRKLPLL